MEQSVRARKPISLIIFDCDGVLVDSERLANQVFAQILLEECGLEFSLKDMFENFVGRSMDQCWQLVTDMLGRSAPESLKQRYHHEIIAALAESVEPVRNIETVLNGLSVPFCVASSGSYKKMQTTLGKTGLIKYFEGKLFSTSEVRHGKPHPDIFLFAANAMGYPPDECLVIEDSPPGVTGAKAAGMTVLGYAELMNPERLKEAGADWVFDDMSKLLNMIEGGLIVSGEGV